MCDVDGKVTGMIVDGVEEVLRIPGSTIESTPRVVTTVNSDYVKGVARLEKRPLILLDFSKIAAEAQSVASEEAIRSVEEAF